METRTHKQAQRWIQARLDHILNESDSARLDAHLQNCATCREISTRLAQVNSGLREYYQSRTLSIFQSDVPQQTAYALHTLNARLRLKMKTKQILTVTNSITFVAAMAILAIGLSFILSISTKGREIQPVGQIVITPTSTPIPWTEANPLHDPDQIETTLTELADKNVSMLRQAAWVHTLRKDLAQPDMIHSTYSDSWFHYPQDDQTCVEGLMWVRDRPETSTEFLQIIVVLPSGTYGDLIQLRDGNEQVARLEPGENGCSLEPEFTPVGQFAMRLENERVASQNQEMPMAAWYATQDGQEVFVVSATFTQPSKANYTGITKETRSFNLETGEMVREGIRMEWDDGSVFGESLQGYETTFFSELPTDIATQYEHFAAEVKAYADGTVPDPIAVPLQDGETSLSLDNLPYTKESPLIDGQTILQVLHALKQRQLEQLAEPGWYLYGRSVPNPDDWMLNRYLLTHTLDESGACEYMSYYVKDDTILPQEIILSDGRWGLISVVDAGQISMGDTGKINWSNGPMTDTCQVQNTETVSFIQNETDYFRDIVEGKTQGTYKAWVEEIGGRKMFVLYYDIAVNGFGNVMDPDTRKLEAIDRNQNWVYFDLDWGTVLFEDGEQIFTLQNGKTIGSAPSPDKSIDVGYTYYQELSPALAEAYEKAVADLETYLTNSP